MSPLFQPLRLRSVDLGNRIVVSPMCQYVAQNGTANDWHLMHVAQFAMGGAGLVFIEATHVSPEARITPGCLGLWSDENERAIARVLRLCRQHGTARLGIQLAHSGRRGSARTPLDGGTALPKEEGGWQTVAPSARAYGPGWPQPRTLDAAGLHKVRRDFTDAARRAARLGFDAVELHMAHGYLLHEFLSPLANARDDEYGGSLENRLRFPLEVFEGARAAFPADLPLGVRISATDWVEGGWDLDQAIVLATALQARGCDFIDVSSGGLDPGQQIELRPGYQVPFAAAIRARTGLPTIAVGLITAPRQAEAILAEGQADLVALARAAMDDPHWAWHAAQELGCAIDYPPQYIRADPKRWPGARRG